MKRYAVKQKENENNKIQHLLKENQQKTAFPYHHGHRLKSVLDFSLLTKGFDEVIRCYFFQMSDGQRRFLLRDYEQHYGHTAAYFLKNAYPLWKLGIEPMPLNISQQLFDLIPSHMPHNEKFTLIEALWQHYCPVTVRYYLIGCEADLLSVMDVIRNDLHQDVEQYFIDAQLIGQFSWLSNQDVAIQQQLFNHIRNQEKCILEKELAQCIPILQTCAYQVRHHSVKNMQHRMLIGKNAFYLKITQANQIIKVTESQFQYYSHHARSLNDYFKIIVLGFILTLSIFSAFIYFSHY